LWYVCFGEMMNKKELRDIIIIGAGAAGLMAAVAAKTNCSFCDVLVLEKNLFAGKKIYATGNGKSNFLNRDAKPTDYFSREKGETLLDLLQTVFAEVPVSLLEEEFKRMGIVAYLEEDGRLYPRSLQAKSVVEALLEELRSKNVSMVFGATVKSCCKEDDCFKLVTQDGKEYFSRNVILTTGGKAGCQYGSEGDGYKLATALTHRIVKPIPALTQIVTQENMENIFGVRVKSALYLWRTQGKEKTLVAKDAGEVQFTKEGISGICTFNISRFLELEEDVSYKIVVDPFQDYTEEQLAELFTQRRQNLADRAVGSILFGLVPNKLCDEILKRTDVSRFEKVENISNVKLQELAKNCKKITFTALKTKSWKDAQVTAGGVVLSEIKGDTLESKLKEGLFFAGEILDVDGPCGGFNLGWAFASGYVAGKSAAEKCKC
jgi:predicted Rossmann fold flavoprotein